MALTLSPTHDHGALFSSSLGPRNLQPGVGLGSSLSHSRLDTTGALAHSALSDLGEQVPVVFCGEGMNRGLKRHFFDAHPPYSNHPVFKLQARYFFKVAGVVGDQN